VREGLGRRGARRVGDGYAQVAYPHGGDHARLAPRASRVASCVLLQGAGAPSRSRPCRAGAQDDSGHV